jgi:CBS domain-containing protein
MSAPVAVVDPAETLAAAAGTMLHRGVRRLLVVDGAGVLVGVVSRADLVRGMLRDDAAIRTDVLAEITDAGLVTAMVPVSVVDGVVTLSGRVASSGQVAGGCASTR